MDIIKFDEKVQCGPEFVALRLLDNCDDLKVGNIWLPQTAGANERLARCVIEDCGSKAAEEYGIKAGDYVMIDRLSTFAHTAPVCLVKYNNVICLTDENGESFKPLKGMLFVEPDQKDSVTNVGGVYVQDYDEKLNTGTVTASAVDDAGYPFAVGDKVLVVKGGDQMVVGDKTVHIYKKDMLICKILEKGEPK